MGISRAEIKAQAKEQLKGKVFKTFGVIFLVLILAGFCGGIFGAAMVFAGRLATIVSLLYLAFMICVALPLGMGLIALFLSITYGEEPSLETVFSVFKKNYTDNIVVLLLMEIYICLWSLLFIIPGIVMAFAYSQAPFILLENPGMKPSEALRRSKEMMKGHKWEYFVLQLSFIPWSLLVSITCGLAIIYVYPYMNVTFTNYYHRLKSTMTE